MDAVDFLGHFGGTLQDAAGDLGIKRQSLECVPQDGLGVSSLLGINARGWGFRLHILILSPGGTLSTA
jgi:hypothetical protein